MVGQSIIGVRGQRLAPDGGRRTAGCVWVEQPGRHDSAQVSMVREPDSEFTGRPGIRAAKEGGEVSAAGDARRRLGAR